MSVVNTVVWLLCTVSVLASTYSAVAWFINECTKFQREQGFLLHTSSWETTNWRMHNTASIHRTQLPAVRYKQPIFSFETIEYVSTFLEARSHHGCQGQYCPSIRKKSKAHRAISQKCDVTSHLIFQSTDQKTNTLIRTEHLQPDGVNFYTTSWPHRL